MGLCKSWSGKWAAHLGDALSLGNPADRGALREEYLGHGTPSSGSGSALAVLEWDRIAPTTPVPMVDRGGGD